MKKIWKERLVSQVSGTNRPSQRLARHFARKEPAWESGYSPLVGSYAVRVIESIERTIVMSSQMMAGLVGVIRYYNPPKKAD